MAENYFADLYGIDVSDKTEKKNGLTYLSWSWAWAELKKRHPDAQYTIYENPEGLFYHTDGRTCWVKTGVTVNGLEHIEYLPVMDFKNRSVTFDQVTSMDVNKAIQRSLTKAVARHGLGLYIYAGEDLPEDTEPEPPKAAPKEEKPIKYICTACGREILPVEYKGKSYGRMAVEQMAMRNFGRPLCWDCMKKMKEEEQNAEQG